eukprot:scaffold33979_cov60-Phaeocystis_antarctica.AAC.1
MRLLVHSARVQIAPPSIVLLVPGPVLGPGVPRALLAAEVGHDQVAVVTEAAARVAAALGRRRA